MKRSREPEDDHDPSSAGQQDVATIPVSKIVGLDVDGSSETPATDLRCSLPGHLPGLAFTSYKDYESHYIKAHTNRCLDCRKTFPSSHILDLHINEFHNALTELKKERGEATFACFVETCDEKRKTPAERRAHLIEKHLYPANYFFAVTKVGIDRRQSMLVERNERKAQTDQRGGRRPRGQKTDKKTGKDTTGDTDKGGDTGELKDVPMREADEPSQRQHSIKQTNGGENASAKDKSVLVSLPDKPADAGTEAAVVDTEMADLSAAMSSLRFVPRAVRFGPRQRAGFPPR